MWWRRRPLLSLAAPALLLAPALLPSIEARGCQIRNFAGEPVNFYWMDVTNWGNYVQQTKQPLPAESSAPIKTFEGHRFFAAFAKDAHAVPSWDPNGIPENAQFVHRGFDQVVTAKVNATTGALYLDDWDIHEGEMAKLARVVADCASDDEEAYAQCVLEKAGAAVQRLEAEKDFITQQTVNMRERMGRAFCTAKAKSPPLRSFDTKSASLPTPEPGTGRLRRRKLTVDVLAEDDAVAVYHLKGFLDKNATRALLLNAPSVEERHAAMTPAPGFKPDAALVEVARWAEDFVAAELESLEGEKKEERRRFRPSAALGVEAVVRGEPLHFFRHDDNGIHAPPCDGHCPLLARPTAEYAATLLMYPKVPATSTGSKPRDPSQKNERPPATGPTAWQVTLQGGERKEAGFVSGGNDAVLLLYKTAGGYSPEILPKLVPCPMVEGTLTVTRWVPRRQPVAEGAGGDSAHEEL